MNTFFLRKYFQRTDKTPMDKFETLEFGGRCYIKAVKIFPEFSSLWHDLGMNYFYQSKCASEGSGSPLVEKAVQAVKKAIQLEPGNHRHWTALGFIACSEAYYKPDLAQHCFIKSVQAEQNNAVAWTNLASLYLKHDNVKLAHEAFKIAQRLEPSYVSCWIGQAIIAEIVGHEDAMDLFRHTTDLGNHLESGLGYSHWVCTMLRSKDTHDSYIYQYAIESMAAVPASIDALARYTDRVKTNPVAYNMYGILLERQKLFRTAAAQFKSAMKLLSDQGDSLLREVTCNYARVLCACEEYEMSCSIYESIENLDNFTDVCQSALAFYKCGQLEKSFQAYNKAAELAATDADKSHVLAAVGMVIYKFGNPDSAKTKFFESAQMEQPSVVGLNALCALGLTQSDDTLATAALQELLKLEDSLTSLQRRDVALFTVLIDNLQGNPTEGFRKLQRQLMLNPCDQDLWKLLVDVLQRFFPERGVALTNTAKTTLVLDNSCKMAGNRAVSVGQLNAGLHSTRIGSDNSLMTAQRAVYFHPDVIENWACLAAAVHAEALLSTEQTRRQALFEQEISILSHVLGKDTISLELKLWCHKQKTVCAVHANKHTEVLTSLEALLEDFGTEKHSQQFFQIFQHVLQGDLKGMANKVQSCNLVYYWKIMVEMYMRNGLLDEAERAVNQCVSSTDNRKTVVTAMLVRLAHGWFLKAMEAQDETSHGKFNELATQISSLTPECTALLLMEGLLNLNKNARLARRKLQDVCEQEMSGHLTGSRRYTVSLARRALIYLMVGREKDAEVIQTIARQAEEEDDIETVNYVKDIGLLL